MNPDLQAANQEAFYMAHAIHLYALYLKTELVGSYELSLYEVAEKKAGKKEKKALFNEILNAVKADLPFMNLAGWTLDITEKNMKGYTQSLINRIENMQNQREMADLLVNRAEKNEMEVYDNIRKKALEAEVERGERERGNGVDQAAQRD